jgi:DNA-binding transcriptional regulator YbjK
LRPANKQRRTALTDAAIDVVVRDGLHGLSHRAVDEAANVPRGTTSNYFRSRDALMEATTRRLMDLHFELMQEHFSDKVDRAGLIDSLSGVLEQALTEHPDRYLAMLELALQNARRPTTGHGIAGVINEAMALTYDIHGADDEVPAKDVQLLSVFYNGLLFTWTVMPQILAGRRPGEITHEVLEKLLSAD